MKKILLFLFAIVAIKGTSQSLFNLDREPSFKGITIGVPITNYSSILRYYGSSNGMNSYSIIDPQYLSIFNIRMSEAIVVEKDGLVNAVCLYKDYSPGVFYPRELQVLQSNLSSKYGKATYNLDDFSSTPTIAGDRWQTSKVVLDVVYLFYGTDMPGSGLRYMLYKRKDDY